MRAGYDAGVKAEIVTIGDELCRGEITDTNAQNLAAALWLEGVTCAWITSCRDDAADIREAVTTAARRAGAVIVSGGLGPTSDDLTVDVMSALCATEPEIEPEAHRRMADRYAAMGRTIGPHNERQVRIPGTARALTNPVGAAPGFEVTVEGTPVFCLPGVPAELLAIFSAHVSPRIAAIGGEALNRRREHSYRVFGLGESDVAAALATMDHDGLAVHYRVAFPEIVVKVVTRGENAAARLAAADATIRERLGQRVVKGGVPEATVASVMDAGHTLATAESCTGGLAGQLITRVAGASAIYRGGIIAYHNDAKRALLGVSEDTLRTHGAVSAECAGEMAHGAKTRLAADWGVAITGVAGPSGGTADKPVGTVFIAAAGPQGEIPARRLLWPGPRESVRRFAAYCALDLVRRALEKDQ